MKQPTLKPNDVHVVINDWETRHVGEATCYNADGTRRWKIPALCKGIRGPRFDLNGGDTPPGLYLAGQIFVSQPHDSTSDWHAYGRYFIDMEEQENQERRHGRAGIGWHGGGTNAPNPLAPKQPLLETLGCVRSHNEHMAAIVIPTLEQVRKRGGRMWITVNQF
jgi:hypothetical protein